MRLIDADALRRTMYHEAMEKDSDEQKWDGGCWVRYKMFERIIEAQPTIEPEPQWIPCSERLPKAFEYCLWTTADGKVVYHYCDGQFSKYIAWMPLPEPARLDGES